MKKLRQLKGAEFLISIAGGGVTDTSNNLPTKTYLQFLAAAYFL